MMIELHCVYISLSIAKYISSRLNIVKIGKIVEITLNLKNITRRERDGDFDVYFV